VGFGVGGRGRARGRARHACMPAAAAARGWAGSPRRCRRQQLLPLSEPLLPPPPLEPHLIVLHLVHLDLKALEGGSGVAVGGQGWGGAGHMRMGARPPAAAAPLGGAPSTAARHTPRPPTTAPPAPTPPQKTHLGQEGVEPKDELLVAAEQVLHALDHARGVDAVAGGQGGKRSSGRRARCSAAPQRRPPAAPACPRPGDNPPHHQPHCCSRQDKAGPADPPLRLELLHDLQERVVHVLAVCESVLHLPKV
jgi:hypothetical protein